MATPNTIARTAAIGLGRAERAAAAAERGASSTGSAAATTNAAANGHQARPRTVQAPIANMPATHSQSGQRSAERPRTSTIRTPIADA